MKPLNELLPRQRGCTTVVRGTSRAAATRRPSTPAQVDANDVNAAVHAAGMLFPTSFMASYVTGATLPVDGGFLLA